MIPPAETRMMPIIYHAYSLSLHLLTLRCSLAMCKHPVPCDSSNLAVQFQCASCIFAVCSFMVSSARALTTFRGDASVPRNIFLPPRRTIMLPDREPSHEAGHIRCSLKDWAPQLCQSTQPWQLLCRSSPGAPSCPAAREAHPSRPAQHCLRWPCHWVDLHRFTQQHEGASLASAWDVRIPRASIVLAQIAKLVWQPPDLALTAAESLPCSSTFSVAY